MCPELAPGLAEMVQWRPAVSDTSATESAARFARTAGAHKWHHYFAFYDEIFGPLRNRPISLLEIGVYKGASTEVWRQYFHPDSTIVGIDIDPECSKFDRPQDNVHVRIGAQQDPVLLEKVVKEFGPFDLIIDDGSHVASHMIVTFNHLFADGLKEGGIYFVEDTHTNFWKHFRDRERSFFDFCYGLVECMHAHYALTRREEQFRIGDARHLPFVDVPRITTLLQEIRFLDSVVVIRKSRNSGLPQSQHW